jgi:predicted aspartyl protease
MGKMGTFQITIKTANPNDLNLLTAVELPVWVDSGATFTQIPQNIIDKLSIKSIREEQFELADGRLIKRAIGSVLLYVNGKLTIDEVVFGEDNSCGLLGAMTLERTGFLIDLQNQRLIERPGGIIQYLSISSAYISV